MPERHGYKVDGGWASGGDDVKGNSFPQNLTIDSRNINGQPDEYRASQSILFVEGFESNNADEFIAYIADGTNTTAGTPAGSGGESNSYRYGFNGQENDDEIKGEANSLDYGNRIYDSRLGRWLSIDRYSSKYPYISPYSFGLNNPVKTIDIGGDSIWIVISPGIKDQYGRTVYQISINIDVTVMDLSDNPMSLVAVANQMHEDFKESYRGASFYDEKSKSLYEFKIVPVINVAKSMNEVKSSDHLIVFVDEAIDSRNPDGSMRPSGGWGGLSNKTAYVENSGLWGLGTKRLSKAAIHEIGHMMGLRHLLDENNTVERDGDNIMSYSEDGYRFTGIQLNLVWDALLSGQLNQGQNCEFYTGENTNNLTDYFTSSTNEKPWDKNVKKGDKIPKPLKTPKVTTDNDKQN